MSENQEELGALLALRRSIQNESQYPSPDVNGAVFFENLRQKAADWLATYEAAVDKFLVPSPEKARELQMVDDGHLPPGLTAGQAQGSSNYLSLGMLNIRGAVRALPWNDGQSEIQKRLLGELEPLLQGSSNYLLYGSKDENPGLRGIDHMASILRQAARETHQEILGRLEPSKAAIEAYVDMVLSSTDVTRADYTAATMRLLENRENAETTPLGSIVYQSLMGALRNPKRQAFPVFYMNERAALNQEAGPSLKVTASAPRVG